MLKVVLVGFGSFFALSAFAQKKTLELELMRFTAPVNLKALTVRGEAKALFGSVETGDNGVLTALEARVPIESLSTGMKIRDQHMKERIFTAKDGAIPDLSFKSTQIQCAANVCEVQGTLSIAGKPKAQAFQCKTATALECTAQISLAHFEIERPSHLGVKVEDVIEVQLLARMK